MTPNASNEFTEVYTDIHPSMDTMYHHYVKDYFPVICSECRRVTWVKKDGLPTRVKCRCHFEFTVRAI